MAAKIDSVSARERLTPRREPYWVKLSRGCFVGFRKMNTGGHGTWMARSRDESSGKQHYETLGDFATLPAHERYDAATKKARTWLDHLGRGGHSSASVKDACDAYVKHLRTNKRDSAADTAHSYLKALVLSDAQLAGTLLSKLTPKMLENWRTGISTRALKSGKNKGQPPSKSTINRDIVYLRAVLNYGYEKGLVSTDFAWRNELKPLPDADGQRDLYIDKAQRRAMVNAAQPELQPFLRAMAMVPLRPGALAQLTRRMYDPRLKVLSVGQDKTGSRKITFAGKTAQLFEEAARGKAPDACLFTRADGKRWTSDSWGRLARAAVQAAKLPEGTTVYTLRHSVITDLLVEGKIDILTVARVSGTSLIMIEKHYGHLIDGRIAQAMDSLAV